MRFKIVELRFKIADLKNLKSRIKTQKSKISPGTIPVKILFNPSLQLAISYMLYAESIFLPTAYCLLPIAKKFG